MKICLNGHLSAVTVKNARVSSEMLVLEPISSSQVSLLQVSLSLGVLEQVA